jgi:hypothetical protein
VTGAGGLETGAGELVTGAGLNKLKKKTNLPKEVWKNISQ